MSSRSATSRRSRLTKSSITLIVLISVLAAQGLISFVVRPEPYPAIRMPSFGDAPTADGKFANTALDIVVLERDGQETNLSAQQAVGDARFSSARPILDKAFKPLEDGASNPNSKDPIVLGWFKDNLEHIGLSPKSVSLCWRTREVDIVDAEYRYTGKPECTEVDLP